VDAQALNDALAGNYMLVDFRNRSWSGKRTDRAAGDELIATKNAVNDSGAFVKNLMASAGQELKLVHKLGATMRGFVYAKTLPWTATSDGAQRGERLLATMEAMNFLRDLNTHKAAYDAAVMHLSSVFDQRVAEAMHNLAGLSNPSRDDYPTAAEIPALFSVTVDIKPVPSVTDFKRLNVPAPLAEALSNRNMEMAEQRVENARADMRERLIKELQRMNTQLTKQGAGEDTRLHDSLRTNLQGIVDLARNMNFTGNPKLAELADRIEAKLLQHPIDAYKKDMAMATATAAEAQILATDAAMEDMWK